MTISLNQNLNAQYLKAMGIEVWVRRNIPENIPENIPITVSTVTEEKPKKEHSVQLLNWEELENKVGACTACELHKSRTQTVFGVGNRQADLMLIGKPRERMKMFKVNRLLDARGNC